MFSFFFNKTFCNKTINVKKILTRDNSCNVTYSQLINNSFKNSIIICENNESFIGRTPIQSLDLENPTHFKIYQILNELDNNYFKTNSSKFYADEFNTIESQMFLQNEIKNENIKKFLYCFDFDIDKT